MPHPPLTYVDLFCGIGGLSLGFKQAGFELLAAVDIDPKRVHWFNQCVEPEKAFDHDIARLSPHTLQEILQGRKPDLVIGSPPLAWYSHAGRRMKSAYVSTQDEDPRASLLDAFMELALGLQPRAILIDIPSSFLRQSVASPVREELIAKLGQYGYSVHLSVLNALDFGVPQKREHGYVLAVREGFSWWGWPRPTGKHLTLADVLLDLLPTLPEVSLPPFLSQGDYPPGIALLVSGQSRDRSNPRWVSFEAPSFHLTTAAARGHRVRDEKGRWRRLTAECYQRLQGFPERFAQIDEASLAAGTPPPLAEAVASVVWDMLVRDPEPERLSLEAFLQSTEVEEERERLAEYFGQARSVRSQQKWKPDHDIDYPLKELLRERFGHKCAYCERLVSSTTAVIDRFRPVQEAMDLKGKIHRDHYWWLAFAQENLYLTCRECNVAKANLFPVAGKRAPLKATGDALFAEKPLLLDPRSDWQEVHWYVDSTGHLLPRTRRGEATIQVLRLNRANLVSERRAVLAELQARFTIFARTASPSPSALSESSGDVEFVMRLFAVEPVLSPEPYVSAQRQWLRRFFLGNRELLNRLPDQLQVQIRATSGARDQSGRLDADQDEFAVGSAIRRIEIRNFMAVGRLKLEIPEQKDRYTPWLMLLGENGTGKSSVLRAIALTLMGSAHRSRLGVKPQSVLRNGSRKGYVRIHLEGKKEPLEMRFGLTEKEFQGPDQTLPILLAGYGATRLPPKGRTGTLLDSESVSSGGSEAVRTDNLFDPYCPLVDADRWLAGLDRPAFDDAAMAIKRLLNLNDRNKLTRRKRDSEVAVELEGNRLDQHSDGYRSTIALLADIMYLMQPVFDDSESARGIVLLDELDAHLHPRWMMRIVTGLREVFPRVQFIVTSHDPLCLRGLEEGEVAVVRRDSGRTIRAWTQLPSPDGLRVDQLLTSPYFGLYSTIDPVIEEEFEAYYGLLAKPEEKRTEDDRINIRKHSDKLDKYRLMGDTPRDQLMYAAVDEFLAKGPLQGSPAPIKPVDPALLRRLGEIWESIGGKLDDQG